MIGKAMRYVSIAVLTPSLCGGGINYHFMPKGECPTKGVSPLESNCPAPSEAREKQ